MDKFIFWYKKELKANSLEDAMKKQKKLTARLSSMETIPEKEQQLTDCIGFDINQGGDDSYADEF